MISLNEAAVVSEKDKAILLETKKRIQTFLPQSTVLLYGSVGRGTQRSESDYNILILTEEPSEEAQRDAAENAVLALELAHDVLLSTMYRTRHDWNETLLSVSPFHHEVARNGIVL